MKKFLIVESLQRLRDKKYDDNITSSINKLLENYSEDQLRILLQYRGIKIDNNLINLFFIENVGFRCINEKENVYGKLPICNNIEKYMNNLYLDSFEDQE